VADEKRANEILGERWLGFKPIAGHYWTKTGSSGLDIGGRCDVVFGTVFNALRA